MPDLAAILRARLPVTEVPGWRTHVRPGSFSPLGVIVHHTAGTNSLRVIVNGRTDLPGPLSNLHVPKSGPPNLVSAGRCNHAGAGAAVVLDEVRRDVAPTGSALRRGLLDGPGGNGFFYGIEAENLGDGLDPWPPAQLDTIARICAALCGHHGWRSNRVIGHLEWTRRKPDPRGFSMASMRARVAMLLLTPQPLPEDDMAVIVTKTDNHSFVTDLVMKRPVLGPSHFDELIAAGVKGMKMSDDQIDAIPLAPGA